MPVNATHKIDRLALEDRDKYKGQGVRSVQANERE
jgi:hypothetical protein